MDSSKQEVSAPSTQPVEAKSGFETVSVNVPYDITSSGEFNPAAWDHWLLIGVAVVFSAWVLRTSSRWRYEWKQYLEEKGAQALNR